MSTHSVVFWCEFAHFPSNLLDLGAQHEKKEKAEHITFCGQVWQGIFWRDIGMAWAGIPCVHKSLHTSSAGTVEALPLLLLPRNTCGQVSSQTLLLKA